MQREAAQLERGGCCAGAHALREMQAGSMLDVLQPDEMPRRKVPQYLKALVDALQSRFVEVGDEEDLDLLRSCRVNVILMTHPSRVW